GDSRHPSQAADCRGGDMTAGDPRIVDLRDRVRDERALLAELSARISLDSQKLLKPASNLLDDVEGFFLAPEVLRHPPRNEQQMAEWLRHAGNGLRRGGWRPARKKGVKNGE